MKWLLALAAVVQAGMGPDCDPLDRKCTLPAPQREPCVWVGPHDGKWLRIVDKEDVDPSAPRPCPPVGSASDHDEPELSGWPGTRIIDSLRAAHQLSTKSGDWHVLL